HVKLQPIDFSTKGVFVCGLAHSPKPVDEAIAQGLGAASRAGTFLAQEKVQGNAVVSRIDQQVCWGCGKCVENCAYHAIELIQLEGNKRVSQVQEALCTGCGACAVICPTGAASIFHFNDQEVLTMVDAMLG
ncbi:MAG: 4Fe-4S dicluster-binding protein, partial [Thermodesulfobacteriota bacterium]|nr:4Fe-4S dicluster-binding protein [Thermodesulfobacteriota bacterium]